MGRADRVKRRQRLCTGHAAAHREHRRPELSGGRRDAIRTTEYRDDQATYLASPAVEAIGGDTDMILVLDKQAGNRGPGTAGLRRVADRPVLRTWFGPGGQRADRGGRWPQFRPDFPDTGRRCHRRHPLRRLGDTGGAVGHALDRTQVRGNAATASNEGAASVRYPGLSFTDALTVIGRVSVGNGGDPERNRIPATVDVCADGARDAPPGTHIGRDDRYSQERR